MEWERRENIEITKAVLVSLVLRAAFAFMRGVTDLSCSA